MGATEKSKLNNALTKAGKPMMEPRDRSVSIKRVGGKESLDPEKVHSNDEFTSEARAAEGDGKEKPDNLRTSFAKKQD